MPRARNAGEFTQSLEALNRRIVTISPHAALAYRERMYSMLNTAERIRTPNSRAGIFPAETVWEIVHHLNVLLEALHIDLRAE
jgi:hypothetical protein